MSFETEIDKRMAVHKGKIALTALERSRKLKSLGVTHGRLLSHLNSLKASIRNTNRDISSDERILAEIEDEMLLLEAGDTPIVTEHALLRYVERVLGIDLQNVHDRILCLGESEIVRSGNTIITVYTDKNDHFNLAENEAI